MKIIIELIVVLLIAWGVLRLVFGGSCSVEVCDEDCGACKEVVPPTPPVAVAPKAKKVAKKNAVK